VSAEPLPLAQPESQLPGAAVTVEDLEITTTSGSPVVTGVSFQIDPGEVLGLVGESGSGKTTVGLSLLGHARRGLTIAGGSIRLGDQSILDMPPDEMRALRGSLVSYVPQDPASSLNPALRVGLQMREVLEAHGSTDSKTNAARIAEMMREVALPDDPAYLKRYPHELSGGQQQRIGLAMAFANRPRLIVLDEPTTGLDVTTQATVLATVRELAAAHGVAALYVSHDLAVVAALARRVAVMYSGRVVELGPADQLFDSAAHPYTRRLVAAIPRLSGGRRLIGIPGHAPSPSKRPSGCAFAPRCDMRVEACEKDMPLLQLVAPDHSARCLRAAEVTKLPRTKAGDPAEVQLGEHSVLTLENVVAYYGKSEVLHSIDLSLEVNECLAVVGESGSGKTTTARAIAGLHRNWTGDIKLNGEPMATAARSRSLETRREIQYIFQNPYGSLNPRKTVGESIAQPLSIFKIASGNKAQTMVGEMLEQVALSASYAARYPDQLSGGERQRVAIARALISRPSVLICDEVTSALDVSVQAAIVDLLGKLQRELYLSMVFVTHNLPLVRSIAQKVAVLADGVIVEYGDTAEILANPQQPYTQQLIANTPSLEVAAAEAAAIEAGEEPEAAAEAVVDGSAGPGNTQAS
jgi:peptide/nickel transport system ATP-binding protein